MSDTTSLEDEYFARLDAEKKARLAAALKDADAEEKAAELKALHHHHCGKCGHEMITTHYKGVEIEVCAGCNAVLLDPGELEQLAGPDRHGALQHIAQLFGFHPDRQ
jgi:hypothetical protein